jgi:hypothetical protein
MFCDLEMFTDDSYLLNTNFQTFLQSYFLDGEMLLFAATKELIPFANHHL